MDAQRRSGVRRRPVERARFDVSLSRLLEVAAEPEGEDFRGVDALAVRPGEVARAVDVDDAGDPARFVRVAPLRVEAFDIAGVAEELSEMAPCRAAGDADPLG